MDNTFEQQYKILSTQIDGKTELGIVQVLGLNQDNFCEYFRIMGCDGLTMIPKVNCFFVTTKTRFKILDRARWLDTVVVKSTVSKKSVARIECDCYIMDKDGGLIAYGKQEMCAMDKDTRKLRVVDSTLFPKDLVPAESNDIVFDKWDFDKSGTAVDTIVKYSNVDFFGHTNNVEYVKIMLDVLPMDLVKSITINDLEIHYLHESKMGDILRVEYIQKSDTIDFMISKDGEEITKARMFYSL